MKSAMTLTRFLVVLWPALVAFNAAAVTRYVDLNSPSPAPPYTNWPTAATNIQDAIDAAVAGDTVLVTNGIYATGGRVVPPYRLTNRVVVDKAIKLESVNGPAATVIQGNPVVGSNAVRCVWLTNTTSLVGFTLTQGATRNDPSDNISFDWSGGGAWCLGVFDIVISNCVFSSNSATYYGAGVRGGTLFNCRLTGNSGSYGGGAGFSTLDHCLLAGNSAASGGGAISCFLDNCTLSGNTAGYGGGAQSSAAINNCTIVSNSASVRGGGVDEYAGQITNSIIYYNTAPSQPNYSTSIGLYMNYCCTTPGYGYAVVIITNAPLFIDLANGNLRLQSNSPCINSGNNAYTTNSVNQFGVYATNTADLDGNPRIVGGTVDIGAYEFQSPSSILSYAWAQQYGLPTDGSADFIDSDGEGMNNWQECIAGTDPTNAASVLRLSAPIKDFFGLRLRWPNVNTRK